MKRRVVRLIGLRNERNRGMGGRASFFGEVDRCVDLYWVPRVKMTHPYS